MGEVEEHDVDGKTTPQEIVRLLMKLKASETISAKP